MANFAHYVVRTVVEVNYSSREDPWFRDNQPDDQGFDRPSYHVTRSKNGPAARVCAGDTLWIFSQLKSPWGMFPPALDAKVIVAHVQDLREELPAGKQAFRFSAGEDSSWFPIFDASETLARLSTIDSKERVRQLLANGRPNVGQALQSMRQLADTAPLDELANTLKRIGFDFVSYRLIDGTKSAFEKSLQLVRAGLAVFWDRWSLPRRMAERREFLSAPAMDAHLRRSIAASKTVWGIRSPLYAEPGSYSQREKDMALELGRFSEWPDASV